MEGEQTNDQAGGYDISAAVDQVADGIMAQLEQPATQPVAEKPKEEPKEEPKQAQEPPEQAAEKPADEPARKEKLKWHGQEVEMTLDEIKTLAQQGYDYTKKMQELSASFAPLQGLKQHIDKDPAFAAHIAGYFSEKAKAKEPEKPHFDDPIEQLKHEAVQSALKAIEESYIKPMNEQNRAVTHAQAVQSVQLHVARDPERERVMAELNKSVNALFGDIADPETPRGMLYRRLDQDPAFFAKTYGQVRASLPPKAEAKQQETTTPKPEPVKRTERAPLLEAAGSAPEDGGAAAEKREKIAKQRVKALRSGDPQALAEYLLASGSIDNLL